MKTPKIAVDFNEMVENDLVLLSKNDVKKDHSGNLVELKEGLKIIIYELDEDENGNPEYIVAQGLVEKNTTGGWAAVCKWNCRINNAGISYKKTLKI